MRGRILIDHHLSNATVVPDIDVNDDGMKLQTDPTPGLAADPNVSATSMISFPSSAMLLEKAAIEEAQDAAALKQQAEEERKEKEEQERRRRQEAAARLEAAAAGCGLPRRFVSEGRRCATEQIKSGRDSRPVRCTVLSTRSRAVLASLALMRLASRRAFRPRKIF